MNLNHVKCEPSLTSSLTRLQWTPPWPLIQILWTKRLLSTWNLIRPTDPDLIYRYDPKIEIRNSR